MYKCPTLPLRRGQQETTYELPKNDRCCPSPAAVYSVQTRSARHGMISQCESDSSFLSSFSEQTPDLIERVRRIFQVNNSMTVGAENGKVFHACLGNVLYLGQGP